jgi:hypothetical protein
MTIPDFAAVEAYHAAVIAAIDDSMYEGRNHGEIANRDRTLADRALTRFRRHWSFGGGCNHCAVEPSRWVTWPCLDALDAWADLTALGTTYGVTAEVGT